MRELKTLKARIVGLNGFSVLTCIQRFSGSGFPLVRAGFAIRPGGAGKGFEIPLLPSAQIPGSQIPSWPFREGLQIPPEREVGHYAESL